MTQTPAGESVRPRSWPGPTGRRDQILSVLKSSDDALTIATIAQRLGIHANTARFHLEILSDEGRVELVASDHQGRGRPPQRYRAVRTMDPSGPRRYRILAEVLAETLTHDPNPAASAVRAGQAWGRRHAQTVSMDATDKDPVRLLMQLLDTIGFAPERQSGERHNVVSLRHCPFLEVAADHREVICPLHLGLMQGAMEVWNADLTVDQLDALVEPDLCLAHLGAPRAP